MQWRESMACSRTRRCPPWSRTVVEEVGKDMVRQGLGATWQPRHSTSRSLRPHPSPYTMQTSRACDGELPALTWPRGAVRRWQ